MNCCRPNLGHLRRRAVLRRCTFTLAVVLVAGAASAQSMKQLTFDGTLKRDPRFIDGGKAIVYCYDENPALVRMMKLVLGQKEPTPFFADAGNKHHIEPALSPDGQWISYTQCTGNLTARLVIKHLPSGKESYVIHGGRGGTRSPVFTPDSKRVIYAFAERGPQQLWSVDTQAKDKKQITTTQGVSNWPTITPDGKTLIFANSREKNYEIYTMGIDGSNEKRLTNNSLMDIRPAVSHDGQRIAFVSTRSGNREIFVMNLDGSGLRQITNSDERDDYPSWHPNNRQLVIVSERDGDFDLYLIDVDDSRNVAASNK